MALVQNVEELAPIDQHLEKEHQEKTKVKNIEVGVSKGSPDQFGIWIISGLYAKC